MKKENKTEMSETQRVSEHAQKFSKKISDTKEKETEQKEVKLDEVTILKNQLKELTEILQRVQADFDNYRKRVEKDRIEFCSYANKELIVRLLPILDSFELALRNKNNPEFGKGVELIYAQLFSLLNSHGLKHIKTEGKFDPNFHEVLLTEKADEEDIILEELQKGYMLNNFVLRTSKVKVSKK